MFSAQVNEPNTAFISTIPNRIVYRNSQRLDKLKQLTVMKCGINS
jgi:hypothetical protein